MKTLFAAALAALVAGTAHAGNDPKVAIAALNARLAGIGAPRVEGTAPTRGKDYPALFFGTRKINNNYDVVDEIRKKTGAAATVFVRAGDDYVRISTNVITPEGKRGIGTPLARAAAYAAIRNGDDYCGQVDVLGTPFDACYHAIKDSGGQVIGITYVGYKR